MASMGYTIVQFARTAQSLPARGSSERRAKHGPVDCSRTGAAPVTVFNDDHAGFMSVSWGSGRQSQRTWHRLVAKATVKIPHYRQVAGGTSLIAETSRTVVLAAAIATRQHSLGGQQPRVTPFPMNATSTSSTVVALSTVRCNNIGGMWKSRVQRPDSVPPRGAFPDGCGHRCVFGRVLIE